MASIRGHMEKPRFTNKSSGFGVMAAICVAEHSILYLVFLTVLDRVIKAFPIEMFLGSPLKGLQGDVPAPNFQVFAI